MSQESFKNPRNIKEVTWRNKEDSTRKPYDNYYCHLWQFFLKMFKPKCKRAQFGIFTNPLKIQEAKYESKEDISVRMV